MRRKSMSAVADQIRAKTSEPTREDMLAMLEKQRSAFLDEGFVSLETRIDRLNRAIDLVIDNKDELVAAMDADFGGRPRPLSMMTDIMSSVSALKHARKNVKKWMKPEKRKLDFPLPLLGAKARVHFQPKGVVGCISPWNFPVNLTFMPLAGMFAAGNRVMVKPSEFTERTSALMAELAGKYFDETELAFFLGGPEVGKAFSTLPFDHLKFTGATEVGRHVMAAAAKNLTPVTLELGGKSPVIISKTADIHQAAENVMLGKLMNAGQICLAPDYILVQESRHDELLKAMQEVAVEMYPKILANDEYTSVINERHHTRLQGYVSDAKEKGAKVMELNPAGEDFEHQQSSHKIPPMFIEEVSDDMAVMKNEIFGPLLPLMTYREIGEAIDYVNEHPRPLALYYFGSDGDEEREVLQRTTSGGVTLNDVIWHVGHEDLPFGGVGPSGMGAYHGIDGFREFSHRKAVYRQAKVSVAKLIGIRPPYGDTLQKTLKREIKK